MNIFEINVKNIWHNNDIDMFYITKPWTYIDDND